jgi:hypothetical protein
MRHTFPHICIVVSFAFAGCAALPVPDAPPGTVTATGCEEMLSRKDAQIRELHERLSLLEAQGEEKSARIEELRQKLRGFGVF